MLAVRCIPNEIVRPVPGASVGRIQYAPTLPAGDGPQFLETNKNPYVLRLLYAGKNR